MPSVPLPLKRLVKKIPGATFAFVTLQRSYFAAAELLGFVPAKTSVVSKDYWENRALHLWDVDKKIDPTYQDALGEVIDNLKDLEWKSLLEVGCGYGRVLKGIAESFSDRRLVGGDFSQKQLDHAKEVLSGKSVSLVRLDAKNLPFQDNEFDVIFTSTALIYVHPSEIVDVLKEIYRVSGRYVFLTEYSKEFLTTPSLKRKALGAPYYFHEYRESLQLAGFDVAEARLMKAWQNHSDQMPETMYLGIKHQITY